MHWQYNSRLSVFCSFLHELWPRGHVRTARPSSPPWPPSHPQWKTSSSRPPSPKPISAWQSLIRMAVSGYCPSFGLSWLRSCGVLTLGTGCVRRGVARERCRYVFSTRISTLILGLLGDLCGVHAGCEDCHHQPGHGGDEEQALADQVFRWQRFLWQLDGWQGWRVPGNSQDPCGEGSSCICQSE